MLVRTNCGVNIIAMGLDLCKSFTESWKIGSDLSTATVNQNTASQIKNRIERTRATDDKDAACSLCSVLSLESR